MKPDGKWRAASPWLKCPNPHKAVFMEGVPIWEADQRLGGEPTNTTAMCLVTREVGTVGESECFVLNHGDSEEARRELALHVLSVHCGWSHEYT
jgi:hypothetical protein